MSKAEFILENGNTITVYHEADVFNMIEEYEEAHKIGGFYSLANWGSQIKEVYYNGRRLNDTDYNVPVQKVDLHKFND